MACNIKNIVKTKTITTITLKKLMLMLPWKAEIIDCIWHGKHKIIDILWDVVPWGMKNSLD